MILSTLREAVTWRLDEVPRAVLSLAFAQAAVFVAFIALNAGKYPFHLPTALAVVAIHFVFSTMPALVAWSSLWTSVDMIFFMYVGLALLAGFVVQSAARRLVRRGRSGRGFQP